MSSDQNSTIFTDDLKTMIHIAEINDIAATIDMAKR